MSLQSDPTLLDDLLDPAPSPRPSPTPPRRGVPPRWRRELSGFLGVGAVAFLVQLALFNTALSAGIGVLSSNAVALVCSATVGYLGNRHLSFRHRSASTMGREATVFGAVNLATFALAEAVLSLSYLVGAENDRAVVNSLNLAGIAIGTAVRLICYRRYVFTTIHT